MKIFDPEKLKSALLKEEALEFSLLFGSAVNGVLPADHSDIDIAVYFNRSRDLDLLSGIIGLCQAALDFENIDLLVLNGAGPLPAFEALKGKLLFCRNMDAYSAFFSLTCRLYEDEMMRIHKAG